MTNPKRKYYPDGKLHIETWYQNGECHREDGPAILYYFESGEISLEYWFQNGKCHREDGPAYIDYYKSGKIDYEEWYLHGKLHRTDGPAIIQHKTSRKKWFLRRVRIHPEEWLEENNYKWPLSEDQQTELLLRFG